jgi:hypothetical protein
VGFIGKDRLKVPRLDSAPAHQSAGRAIELQAFAGIGQRFIIGAVQADLPALPSCND